MDNKHAFTASRLVTGLLYSVRIEVTPDRVTRIEKHLFSSSEESIAIPRVASVTIKTGLFFSQIRIDSTGGSNPIMSRGHYNEDARTIRDLIEKFQKATI